MSRKTDTELMESIPAQDWEATPASVRGLVLSLLPLATEALEWRARTAMGDSPIGSGRGDVDQEKPKRYLHRYQALVDRLFLHGLSAAEQQELERLGEEIDAGNALFYAAALRRMEAAVGNGRK